MSGPESRTNPITLPAGECQHGVDPARLRPSRRDMISSRVEFQRALLRAGRPRFTPIRVTIDGVIVDGHHAVRAAAEEGTSIDVLIVADPIKGRQESILDLPLR